MVEILDLHVLSSMQVHRDQEPRPRPKAKYQKPMELQEFEQTYNAHAYDNLPHVPEYGRVKTHFRDDTANGLTKAIIAHLQFNGHFAGRVNTTGVFDKRTGLYRQTNALKGMADISAVINGMPVQIEIKIGSDRPRAAQLKVQAEYEKAGGRYVFVHNFKEYITYYKQLTK